MLLKTAITLAAMIFVYQAMNGVGDEAKKMAANRIAEQTKAREEKTKQASTERDGANPINRPAEIRLPYKIPSPKAAQQNQTGQGVRKTEKWESRECRFWWEHAPNDPVTIAKARKMQSCQGGF